MSTARRAPGGIRSPAPSCWVTSMAATRWPFCRTRYAAPRAPPAISNNATAARAGLRSRATCGGRRLPGAVGRCPLSCAGCAPRVSVPRSPGMTRSPFIRRRPGWAGHPVSRHQLIAWISRTVTVVVPACTGAGHGGEANVPLSPVLSDHRTVHCAVTVMVYGPPVDGARKVTPHGGAAAALPVYLLPVAPQLLYRRAEPVLTATDTLGGVVVTVADRVVPSGSGTDAVSVGCCGPA